MRKTQKEIIQKLATKYNLPLAEVERAVMHQFKYVAKVMEDGNFDTIRLPYFGKFSSKKSRRDHLTRLKDGSNNNR